MGAEGVLKVLAANLAACMRERGMTEQALADASGVSKRTVGNFLRPTNRHSSSSNPSGTLGNLFKLAEALGCEPWELVCDPPRRRFVEAVDRVYDLAIEAIPYPDADLDEKPL